MFEVHQRHAQERNAGIQRRKESKIDQKLGRELRETLPDAVSKLTQLSILIQERELTKQEWLNYAGLAKRLSEQIVSNWEKVFPVQQRTLINLITEVLAAFSARYGNDEFVIDIPDLDAREIALQTRNYFSAMQGRINQGITDPAKLIVSDAKINARVRQLADEQVKHEGIEAQAQVTPLGRNTEIVHDVQSRLAELRAEDFTDPREQIDELVYWIGDYVRVINMRSLQLGRVREELAILLSQVPPADAAPTMVQQHEQDTKTSQAELQDLEAELPGLAAHKLLVDLNTIWTILNSTPLENYAFRTEVHTPEERLAAFRAEIGQDLEKNLKSLIRTIANLPAVVLNQTKMGDVFAALHLLKQMFPEPNTPSTAPSLQAIDAKMAADAKRLEAESKQKLEKEQTAEATIKLNMLANPLEMQADLQEFSVLVKRMRIPEPELLAAMDAGNRDLVETQMRAVEQGWRKFESLLLNKWSNIQELRYDEGARLGIESILKNFAKFDEKKYDVDTGREHLIATHQGYLDSLMGLIRANKHLPLQLRQSLIIRIQKLEERVIRVRSVVLKAPVIATESRDLPEAKGLKKLNPLIWENRYKYLVGELTKTDKYTREKIARLNPFQAAAFYYLLRDIRTMVNAKADWEKMEPRLALTRGTFSRFSDIIIELNSGNSGLKLVDPDALHEAELEIRQIVKDIEERYRRERDPFKKTFDSLMNSLDIDLSQGITNEMGTRVIHALNDVQTVIQAGKWEQVTSEHKEAIMAALLRWQTLPWEQVTIITKGNLRNAVNDTLNDIRKSSAFAFGSGEPAVVPDLGPELPAAHEVLTSPGTASITPSTESPEDLIERIKRRTDESEAPIDLETTNPDNFMRYDLINLDNLNDAEFIKAAKSLRMHAMYEIQGLNFARDQDAIDKVNAVFAAIEQRLDVIGEASHTGDMLELRNEITRLRGLVPAQIDETVDSRLRGMNDLLLSRDVYSQQFVGQVNQTLTQIEDYLNLIGDDRAQMNQATKSAIIKRFGQINRSFPENPHNLNGTAKTVFDRFLAINQRFHKISLAESTPKEPTLETVNDISEDEAINVFEKNLLPMIEAGVFNDANISQIVLPPLDNRTQRILHSLLQALENRNYHKENASYDYNASAYRSLGGLSMDYQRYSFAADYIPVVVDAYIFALSDTINRKMQDKNWLKSVGTIHFDITGVNKDSIAKQVGRMLYDTINNLLILYQAG